ncbi:glycosyltransferase [Bergeyella sp. RCAD1439]|uniref:glycosyltransferase n=1 Tax=Bergeyella anatis TaxID=3113737 RepID=UPI002E19FCF3|nr:glycosyltransferase [Bergeyella sp. RCAD1439]
MKKKTIVFVLPDLETGGAERIVTTIANHLPRDRFIPKLMLLRKEGAYLDFLKADVEVIDLQTSRIRYGIFPILRQLRRLRPDIVFSGFGEVNAYLSLFIRWFPKTKFIARETNVVSKHVTRKEIRFFYRFYNNYHRIICQSDDMRTDLIGNFNVKPEKTVKINNPVDFPFIDLKMEEGAWPEAYRKDVKNVVAVGNLSVRKGFDNLLKVFAHLKNEPIFLHILGEGRDGESFRAMKASLGLDQVFFHGKQKNPYPYLKNADLFILSSRYEGFPNVLLEAGACGTYALSNDCPGGITEIIQSGVNGTISDIENPMVFAEKIKKLLSENYDRLRVRQAIESRFSKELIMQQYVEVLEAL